MRIEFDVPGEPRGKERHRTGKYGIYTPSKTVKYEKEIQKNFRPKWLFKSVVPFSAKQPLAVVIKAYYKIPKTASKADRAKMQNNQLLPTKKPDADNIAKVVMDALNGVAWKDDAQVVYLRVMKFYAPDEPYIHVILEDV